MATATTTQSRAETGSMQTVTLGTSHFKEANELVREAFEHADTLDIQQAHAQRYLGAAMPEGKRLEIHGTPGNDLGCYMDGGQIEVFGNAQDQVGNTMNRGSIVIHGRCGDAAGYGMRGGQIVIRDDCGWRVGVHMKEYQEHRPAIVIGGDAGNFLGEYMAGGIIVLFGTPGKHLATGMHGGVMYLAHQLDQEDIPAGLVQHKLTDQDVDTLAPLLQHYRDSFGADGRNVPALETFWALRPESSRPYGSMYAN